MIKYLWKFKKSSFLIIMAALCLVSSLFYYQFYKKVEESQANINSFIREREYEFAENIFKNKNIKSTEDAISVIRTFNVSAYEVYSNNKVIFRWPESSSQLLAKCDRPFDSEITLGGVLIGSVKTCLSTASLVQGTFSTSSFLVAFFAVLTLFIFIALQPLMGYKKSLNATIESLKKWNNNPNLITPPKSDDAETNKIIALLSSGVEARVELSEVQTQLGMEKEMSRFIKALAHDLREPMYNQQNIIDMIEEKMKLKDYSFFTQDFYDHARKSSTRILDIVSDLMETHKREAQFIQKNISAVNVVPIFKSFLEESKRSNAEVIFELNSPDKLLIETDPKEFKRVLANIVKNGIEALDKNVKNIKVSITKQNDQAEITIEDNGKGIASHDLPKVFDEHFSKGKEYGNGIGLYYVQKKIHSWGGNISIDSLLGKGTIVKINFLETGLQG